MWSCASQISIRRAKQLRDGITAPSLMPIVGITQHREQVTRFKSRTVDMLWASNYLDSEISNVAVEWLHAVTRGPFSLDVGTWLLARFKASESSHPQLARVRTLLCVGGNFYVHLTFFEGALQQAPHGSLWALQAELATPTCETCCLLQDLALTSLHAHEMRAREAAQNWLVFREARCVFNTRASAPVGT